MDFFGSDVETIKRRTRSFFLAVLALNVLSFLRGDLSGPDPAFASFAGWGLAVFDFFMDVVLFFLAAAGFYGLWRYRSWTYLVLEAFSILAAAGEFFGLALIYLNLDRLPVLMAAAAASRGAEASALSMNDFWLVLSAVSVFRFLIYIAMFQITYSANRKLEDEERKKKGYVTG